MKRPETPRAPKIADAISLTDSNHGPFMPRPRATVMLHPRRSCLSTTLLIACLSSRAPLAAQQYDLLTIHTEQPKLVAKCAAPLADLDGDGYVDFLIGDYSASFTVVTDGVVQLRSGLDGRVLRHHSGPTGSQLGRNLIVLDDIDKDGVPDYAVGAATYPYDAISRTSGRGAVFVFSGKTGQQLYVIDGDKLSSQYSRIGSDLALLDDLDADGVRDYVVCAVPKNGAELYVISGATGVLLKRFDYPSTSLGNRVAAAPDLDLDGKADICAHLEVDCGLVIVSSRSGQILRSVTKLGNGSMNGDLDASSDLDGDGLADVVTATTNESIVIRSMSGQTGTMFAISSRTSALLWKAQLQHFNSQFGRSLCAVGDLNSDGVTDFAVSGVLIDYSWGVVMVSGKDGSTLGVRVDTITRDDAVLLRAAGDLNQDGHLDFFNASSQIVVQRTTVPGLRVQSTVPLSLATKTHNVPVIQGGYQQLDLDAGAQHANALAFVLGTASGTSPGISFGSIHLPLNPDVYFAAIASSPHTFVFNNLLQLDANGRGQAAFLLPPGHPASLAGVILHHAFVTLPNLDFASNAVPVRLTLFP